MKENRPAEVDYTTPLEGFKLTHGSHPERYNVDWVLRDKEGKTLESQKDRICFANMQSAISRLLRTDCTPHTLQYTSKNFVPEDTAIRFMELGREHGFFPPHGDIEIAAKTSTIQFAIDNISQKRIYWFLCYFRYLRDDSFKVKSLVKLIDEYKIGFWPAFFYVICNLSTSDGHNFIPIMSYSANKTNSLKVRAVYIHKLYKILTRKDRKTLKNPLSQWTFSWNREIFEVRNVGGHPSWGTDEGYYGPVAQKPKDWAPETFLHAQNFLHPLFAEFLTLKEPQGDRAKEICKELGVRMKQYIKATASTTKEKKNGENLLLRCV